MQTYCLTSSPFWSVHSTRRGGMQGNFFLLSVQLSSGKSSLYMLTCQYNIGVCILYFFKSYFIAFVLVLWHETGTKQEIKVEAERQQCLGNCFSRCMLIQPSLLLIYIWYIGFTFIRTFFCFVHLYVVLFFWVITLLYCSSVHNSTAAIFMKGSLVKQTSLACAPWGLIKVLVILTIHVNALNFNYIHMQINSTCSLYL